MNGRMHEWLAVLTEAETNRSWSACTRIPIPFLRARMRVLVHASTCPANLRRGSRARCTGTLGLTGASMKPFRADPIKFLPGTFLATLMGYEMI